MQQSALFEPTQPSAAISNVETNEREFGFASAHSVRPILSCASLTPAAARILARKEFRDSLRQSGPSRRTLRSSHNVQNEIPTKNVALRAGRQSPMLAALLKDTEGTTWDCAWRNLFSSAAHPEDLLPQSSVRESHVTALVVRGSLRSFQDTKEGSKFTDSLESNKYEHDVTAFQVMVSELVSEGRWIDVAAKLCNIRILRRLGADHNADRDEARFTNIYDQVAFELETNLKRNPEQDGRKLVEILASIREHRNFLLEFQHAFSRRPQSVLEIALSMRTRFPSVTASAIESIRKCEKTAYELLEEYQTVMLHNIQSVVGSVKLAKIKAEIREIWLDGALTNSNSPHGIATKFRLLISFICLRILQVRKVLAEVGIPVEGRVLNEILREDVGIYPSNFDQEVAKQAIQEAQKALLGLEKETEQAMQEKNARNKKSLDQHKASQDQESELSEIRQSKREKESSIIKKAAEDVRFMKDALCEEIWCSECGGSLHGKHGGAVVLSGNLVVATSNDSSIEVIDMGTVMFKRFAKRFKLSGHANKVLSLVTYGTNILFSGSLDCTIRVWDLETRNCIQVLDGHNDAVSCLAVAMEDSDMDDVQSKFLCSGSFDTTIKIWAAGHAIGNSAASVTPASSHPHQEGTTSTPKELSWTCVRTLFGHGCFIHSIVADGYTIYSGGEDGLIKIWHVDCKHSRGQLEGCRNVYCLCLQDDHFSQHEKSTGSDRVLLSSGIDATICLWDLNHPDLLQDGLVTKEEAVRFELSPKLELDSLSREAQSLRRKLSFVITPEGKSWVAGVLSDIEDKVAAAAAKAAKFQFVKALKCSKLLIYSGGGEDVIRVWSLSSKSCVGEISNVGGGSHSVALSSQYLAVSCYDNCVRVYASSEMQIKLQGEALERENFLLDNGGVIISYESDLDVPRLLLPSIQVAFVCCGSEHGTLLDTNGFVWCWGSSERGQTGTGTTHAAVSPLKIMAHSEKAVRFSLIAAGNFYSLAITLSGQAWAWGDNSFGQLGMGPSEETNSLLQAKDAILIEIASLTSLARTQPDEVQENKFETKADSLKLAKLKETLIQTELLLNASCCVLSPRIISELKDVKITSVIAGGYHSIFLTDAGNPMSCGLGAHGELGHPEENLKLNTEGFKYNSKPTMVEFEASDDNTVGSWLKVVAIAAGLLHSLFLIEDGKVWGCGSDLHGQLGVCNDAHLRQTTSYFCPLHINILSAYRIQALSAGHFHSIFQTSKGELLAVGNYDGGMQRDVTPTILNVPGLDTDKRETRDNSLSSPVRPSPVVKLSVSGCQTFVSTSLGNTFVFGPRRQMSISEMERMVFSNDIKRAEWSEATCDWNRWEQVEVSYGDKWMALPTTRVCTFRNQEKSRAEQATSSAPLFVVTAECLFSGH